ncbi:MULTISPECIES: DUF2946 family protein [unclassified Achromobacter]|uniref:DUF2946 family protein n=1 Tax=unclassified Achromobacter TaxID=2626865 RepID=UPI000B51AB67|nr:MULTISPECIES: DUF2946 family protein [unclassified Achromobacter]OWT80434.1 hypothetical protein CEY05_03235 [Achromobacter sp. HZ34]OWT82317.1 hypothetical protein CEY04_03235 [Achromobacter sp. HZ28]
MRSGSRNRPASWFALVAAFLLAFYSVMSASALAGTTVASADGSISTIICTASGPRVITLSTGDGTQAAKSTAQATAQAGNAVAQHGSTLPHCCSGGCAMAGAAILPTLYLLAWSLPSRPATLPDYTPTTPPSASGLLASSPSRPRGPPAA